MIIKKLVFYLVKFFKNGSMISKKQLINFAVSGLNGQSIIMIIHNKSMFLASNSK